MPFSIASGILGGISSIWAAKENRKAQREANEANYKLAQYQNNYNFDMWQKQNAYNDPSAQMARLKKAGLNPHLVYGSGGATTTASTPPSAAPMHFEPYLGNSNDANNFFANVMQGAKFFEELALIKQQNKNAQTQQQVMESEILARSIDNSLKMSQTARNRFDLALQKDLRSTLIDAQKAQLRLTQSQVANTDYDTMNKRAQHDVIALQNKYTKQQLKLIAEQIGLTRSQKKNVDFDSTRKSLENKLIEQGINPNDPILFRIMGRAITDENYLTELLNSLKNSIIKTGKSQFPIITDFSNLINKIINPFNRLKSY